MCPDRQLLSVYFVGELVSPWKEKMQSHLASCPDCRVLLENYQRLSLHSPDSGRETELEKAKERVWRNLEGKARFETRPFRETRFWARRISIPFPAAAAAALLIAAFAVFWTMRPKEQASNMTIASEMNGMPDLTVQGMVPVTSINEVLQYIGNRDGTDIIILRLPESRNFTSTGEPAIIRAADYSRRRP